jgi:carboxymethylenebutenolidase
VGTYQVVDEIVVCFTHDIPMDTMLPGVRPTGRYVELPPVVVVKFDGRKVAHEHIYWDPGIAARSGRPAGPQSSPGHRC